MAKINVDVETKKKTINVSIKKIIRWTSLTILFLIFFFGSFYIINAGERGVLITLGNPSPIASSEGLHFKIPIIQSAVIMDVKTLKYQAEAGAASKDLQDVKATIATNYHLTPENVPELYKTVGVNYAEKLIQPIEQEIVKATTAKYTAEEMITKREEVRSEMEQLFIEKLRSRGIIVEQVSIINFEFSPSFTQAIEAKVVAEQNALAAKNKLEQIKYEAEQRIAQAKGEAEAIKIQVEAIKQQGGSQYVQLQSINKWDGKLPTYMLGNSIPFISITPN